MIVDSLLPHAEFGPRDYHKTPHFKGGPHTSYFIFEINLADPTQNDSEFEFLDRIEDDVIQIQSRSMSDPPLSEIDFKKRMATL